MKQKVITHHANQDHPEHCFVRLFKCYLALCQQTVQQMPFTCITPSSLAPRLLCVGREKEPSTLCMLSLPRISGKFAIKSVRYTNLCETCQLFLCERCLPLITLCVDDNEGAIKAIAKLFTYRNYPCVCSIAKSYGT